MPTMMELIERGELQLTPRVLEIMIHLGSAARIAEPKLRTALESQDAVVRVLAAVALGRMNNDQEAAVSVLITELRNQEYRNAQHWNLWLPQTHIIGLDHRQTAAWFLGEIGPSARSALPELTEAMKSNRPWLNVLAARAVWRISGESSESLLVLSNAVQATDELACVLAARALAEVGPAAKSVLPAMLSARTNSLYVRRAINEALKRIDEPTARQVIYQPQR